MADALAKYRAALKRYRKENPNVAYSVAQKRVSEAMKGGKVTGTKKRKRIPAVSHKKARVGARPRKAVTYKKVTISKKRTIGTVERGEKIIREIEKLEKKRAALKHKELRDICQLEINAWHDKLDALKHSHRRKSA